MFLKVFLMFRWYQIRKKTMKNLWKMGLKSKSILEVIFEGFGVDFGRHFRPQNRSKNEKKRIKNKSDFKTPVPERITVCDRSSLGRDRPWGASGMSHLVSTKKQEDSKSKHQDDEKREPRNDR